MPTHPPTTPKFARSVKVIVPASSANLGPGFDCLGLALGLYNTIEMDIIPAGEGLDVDVRGEGRGQLPADATNLVVQSFNNICNALGYGPLAVYIRTTNNIPLGSGMGSSAAATVGGLVAANAVLNAGLSRQEILNRATRIEGHPDNASAALFGGLTASAMHGPQVRVTELSLPEMKVVVALPDIQVSTVQARAALPEKVPLKDAAFNIGQAIFVVKALQTQDYDMLKWAVTDRLHEPYRAELIPGYDEATRAARKKGAAVVISGAGPALTAFAPDKHNEIASAMRQAFQGAGVAARTFVLPVDTQGVQVSVRL